MNIKTVRDMVDRLKLFLDSYWRQRGSKALSILDHYLKNVNKVVPQNMHFILAI